MCEWTLVPCYMSFQVTLEPGQVLYVPPQWWHYVECVTPAISVNTWIETVHLNCLLQTPSGLNLYLVCWSLREG